MGVIPEWRDIWKMYSTWAAGALAVWNMMPLVLSDRLPGDVHLLVSAGLFGAFVLARVLNQPNILRGSGNGAEIE